MEEKKNSSAPYSVDEAKKERSRVLAHKRRATNRSVMDELTEVLPLPKDVVTHLDYSSKLRLALCFFRLKSLTGTVKSEEEEAEMKPEMKPDVPSQSSDVVVSKHPPLFNMGMLQDMMMEALDGFLLVLSSDGVIIYISESVHHHLGIFQSEHIGISIFDMISEEDHKDAREAILKAEAKAMTFRTSAEVSFFCRMKCSRFKVANSVTKSPGYKLVYVSGRMKQMGSELYLVTVVRPVSPPSILELRMEANMFVTHYDLTMNCLFFDGRLKHLLGYSKQDLEGRSPFGLQHHEDLGATAKCGEGILSRGEGLSGYYRFMCHGGYYVWLQTRGTLMHDSRTGKATYIVCMNYIISKGDGDQDLKIRQAITDSAIPPQEGTNQSYDPFPLTEREDGAKVNPLEETSWGHKENVKIDDVYVQDGRHLVKLEDLSDAGGDALTKPSGSTSKSNLSPADSGLHSDVTQNPSGFGSTTTGLSSSNISAPKGYSGAEHCLPDSTTDSKISPNDWKSGQVVSESIMCWSSPPNNKVSDHDSTPPSVFSEDLAQSSHLKSSLLTEPSPPIASKQSVSYDQYQNGNGPISHPQSQEEPFPANYGQDSIDIAFLSQIQSLEGSTSTSSSEQQPGFVQNGFASAASQFSIPQPGSGSGGKLYQLLAQQPQNQSSVAPSCDPMPDHVTLHSIGYQSTEVDNTCYSDTPNCLTSILPAWNGIEAEVRVHSLSQQPVLHQPDVGVVPIPRQYGASSNQGNGTTTQGAWPSDVDAQLPQLTDEDMTVLDYFNGAPPSQENLPYIQAVPMATGLHPAQNGQFYS